MTEKLNPEVKIQSISASDTVFTSGQVRFTGGPNVTVGTDASGVSFSAASQSAQAVGSAIPGGNTTGTTASLPFASNIQFSGGNNITVSQSSGTNSSIIAFSGPNTVAQSAQTQSNIQGIAGSDTTYNTGTVQFTGSNQATVKSGTGQKVIIDVTTAAQSVQTQSIVRDVVISSNTTGTTADVTSGSLTLAGGPNITLSQAGGNAVTISGAGAGGAGGSQSHGGNTTGTTANLPFASNIQLQGGNNITISQSSGTNSSVVVFSAPNQTTQPVGSQNLGGNTTGTTASLPFASNMQLKGGNNITLSQSSGTNSSIIEISGPNTVAQSVQTQNFVALSASNTLYTSGTVTLTGSNQATVKSGAGQLAVIDVKGPSMSYWDNQFPGIGSARNDPAGFDIPQVSYNTLSIQPLNPHEGPWMFDMTASTVYIQCSFTTATTSMSARTHSMYLGIYTMVNSTQISLLNSVSTSIDGGRQSTAWNNVISGARYISIHSSLWSSSPVFTQGGRYWVVHMSKSSSNSNAVSMAGQWWHNSFQRAGTLGGSSVTATTGAPWSPMAGIHGVSQTAFPNAIGASDINKAASMVNFIPYLAFDAQGFA